MAVAGASLLVEPPPCLVDQDDAPAAIQHRQVGAEGAQHIAQQALGEPVLPRRGFQVRDVLRATEEQFDAARLAAHGNQTDVADPHAGG